MARILRKAGFSADQIGLLLSHAAGQSITVKHYTQPTPLETADELRPLIEALEGWHLEGEAYFDRLKAERDGDFLETSAQDGQTNPTA